MITVDYQQEEEANGSDTESSDSDDSAEETADDSTENDTEEDSTVTVNKTDGYAGRQPDRGWKLLLWKTPR